MFSVADKEKPVGLLGVIGMGVAAYAFSRGWQRLGGVGAVPSLALICLCYKTYAYRASLRQFRQEPTLEGKVQHLSGSPRDLQIEAFGNLNDGWLVKNLQAVVKADSLSSKLFASIVDHLLVSNQLVEDYYIYIYDLNPHRCDPAYLRPSLLP